MEACGIAKISPAQMKKLHQGKAVRVKAGTAHTLPLPAKDAKKLRKAAAQNKGMILSAPHLKGGSLFSDAKNWYQSNIPAKYRAPVESLVTMGLQDAGVLEGSGVHRRRGRGMSAKGKQLVRKTLSGKGWKEDLEAFDQWTNKIGDKLTGIARSVDPEGKLQKALINRATDEIDPSAKTARIASQAFGNIVGKPQEETSSYAPAEMLGNFLMNPPKKKKQGSKKPQGPRPKKAMPVVTAEELPESQMPSLNELKNMPIAYSIDQDERLPYQPVRWVGSGKKPSMVKGSPAAKAHMARLRAMKNGGALRPAGY